MLGAAYTDVGVGVTCSGGQAWTVELFGYPTVTSPVGLGPPGGQNAVRGQPGAGRPGRWPARPAGDPVYCPGQTIGPNGAVTAAGGQFPYPYPVAPVPGEPNVRRRPTVGMAATADAGGYWLARSDGSVAPHGDAVSYGSMAGSPLDAPISHIVATADGGGYWLVAADGGIFTFGDAGFFGSMGGQHLNAPVVGMAPTPDGHGYWLVAVRRRHLRLRGRRLPRLDGRAAPQRPGGRHGHGPGHRAATGWWPPTAGSSPSAAPFFGSTGGLHLNGRSSGWPPTADGRRLLVRGLRRRASSPSATPRFRGSAGAPRSTPRSWGWPSTAATGGYWLVAADGGVFSFGAPFFGRRLTPSAGGRRISRPR